MLQDIETIEKQVAHFIVKLLSDGYSPIDINAALIDGASAVMDEDDDTEY